MIGSSLINELHVSDDDIAWVCNLLKLPSTAFCGEDGNDPRLEILKSNETLDVEACPGSGKTTLLVAKLAVLARKWTSSKRGLCVLSHTNVARREIERRLGNTTEGKRLLSYPHFIGTIHGFVNEFLAIPWLRSKPFPIRMIDNEVCQTKRWRKLPIRTQRALEYKHHNQTILRIQNVDFSIGDVSWGRNSQLGKNTDTYKAIQDVCKSTAEEGFFCHDEMFVWGKELLEDIPDIRLAFRERFPFLFIDEVQDTSELQSALLYQLFMEGDSPVTRQRFGDSNQAIFQYQDEANATTDPFPVQQIRRDIPNSHRFGQNIADLANPLALRPQNLVGCGPSSKIPKTAPEHHNAIFLFNEETISNVIPTFAEYLSELFSDNELRAGTFAVVGAVHRPGNADDQLPRFIGHYWPEYDHELTPTEPTPKTFIQYIFSGRKWSESSGEVHHLIEKIAEAILRLIGLSNPTMQQATRKRKHRLLLNLLSEKVEGSNLYIYLVNFFAVEGNLPTINQWYGKWVDIIKTIASSVLDGPVDEQVASNFLTWSVTDEHSEEVATPSRDNLFRYPVDNPKVLIKVGSIHSVKGETHTATLVLDTFFHEHHLVKLKPWILGTKSGGQREGSRNIYRLKQHYVAMSRPSHLLCLAMREDCINNEELTQLKNTIWRPARVTFEKPEWI